MAVYKITEDGDTPGKPFVVCLQPTRAGDPEDFMSDHATLAEAKAAVKRYHQDDRDGEAAERSEMRGLAMMEGRLEDYADTFRGAGGEE